MKFIPKPLDKSAGDIEAQIEVLELEAMRLAPDSEKHRHVMHGIAQLRVYIEIKRWLSAPSVKAVH